MRSHVSVVLRDVQLRHASATAPLFGGPLSVHFAAGFTGVVGANGAGKTTLLLLATGALRPQSGTVHAPARAAYCAQRTDEPPAGLEALLAKPHGEARALRERLGLDPSWISRWHSLSHGERKRLQIGAALLASPDLLALDEPTNHVDAETRAALLVALRRFRGVGLLVSHDRELLDALCTRCLFVEPGGAVLRPGGYTEAAAQAESDRESLQRARERARHERTRLERESVARRAEAARADRRRSKRGFAPKDHDAREKIDRARVTGADAVAGKLLRQLEGRLRQAREREGGLRVEKVRRLGIWLPGARARYDALAAIGPARLLLGDGRAVDLPELVVRPADRIAITGENGAGKSTLLRALLAATRVPEPQRTVMPQEIDRATGRAILAEARGLPRDALGFVMTAVSCLGSRPERLLESTEPSPGELRKLLLALGMRRAPWLVALDEPTNHLDLPSIECLERALAECPCALLLVSHDRRFLEALATREWRIEAGGLREVRAAPSVLGA
jgi:ATPase subunit of ABC transporter with duplicated ATPase domains